MNVPGTRGQRGLGRGLGLRQILPSAVTAMALCFGLTGIRYAIAADWERAIAAVLIAAALDACDGLIARLLKAQSRFGAELDSLSDVIAFGVAPSLILYLWSLQTMPRFGWIFALSYAVACALRLARFNANLDSDAQPRQAAGFFTGVPSPAGAALAFLPMLWWLVTGHGATRTYYVVAPWTLFVAFLMISNVATFSMKKLRVRKTVRLEVIGIAGLVAASLMIEPWLTLLVLTLSYLAMLPVGALRYARIRRLQPAADKGPDEPQG